MRSDPLGSVANFNHNPSSVNQIFSEPQMSTTLVETILVETNAAYHVRAGVLLSATMSFF